MILVYLRFFLVKDIVRIFSAQFISQNNSKQQNTTSQKYNSAVICTILVRNMTAQ